MNITEERKPYVISMTDAAQIDQVEQWSKYIGMTRTKAVTAACMLAFKYEQLKLENELLKRKLAAAEREDNMSIVDGLLAEALKQILEDDTRNK